MPRRERTDDLIGLIEIHRHSAVPVSDQLFDRLRSSIENGRIVAGTPLPSTRTVAKQLGLSRNTVLAAYAELLMHGLVETRVGFGTVVAQVARADRPVMNVRDIRRERASTAALHWTMQPKPPRWLMRAQTLAIRDVSRMRGETIRESCVQAVLQHLALRGVHCAAEDVILFDNRLHALYVLGRVIGGNSILCEEPGDESVRGAFNAAGLQAEPLPVDQLGANIAFSSAIAGAAYVTPGSQMPLGITMNGKRRRMLREWAGKRDAWIIEDDDSSFLRWPVPPPLFEAKARVLHLASVAPVLAPFVTMTCVAGPPGIIADIRTLADAVGAAPHLVAQRLVTRMLTTGALQRERRRLRVRARNRDRAIAELAKKHLSWFVSRTTGTENGDRAILWLHHGCCVDEISDQLQARRVDDKAVMLDLRFVPDAALARYFEGIARPADIRRRA